MTRQRGMLVLVVAMAVLMLRPLSAFADPTNGDLFFTTFAAHTENKVHYNYDGVSTFSLTGSTVIDTTPGADGIVFDPTDTNFLLVGGQGGGVGDPVYRVPVAGGAFTSVAAASPGGAYHLSVDPSGKTVWVAGIPGGLGKVGLGPLTAGSTLTVSGAVTGVDTLAFVPNGGGGFTVWYTSSGPGGFGSIGTIDLTTGVTTNKHSGIDAHGMAYDPFTGDLILMGGNTITQWDPVGNTSVSSFTQSGATFDQGAVDGKGHLFAADNGGSMLFMDYSGSSSVGAGGNFKSFQFLAANLDDVAPLVGPGAKAPEPGTLLLLGGGLAFGAGLRFRRRR